MRHFRADDTEVANGRESPLGTLTGKLSVLGRADELAEPLAPDNHRHVLVHVYTFRQGQNETAECLQISNLNGTGLSCQERLVAIDKLRHKVDLTL